ncbi:hypothetical protein NBRC116592_29680 [Colwellia sp. KU-HH00111]
MKSPKVSKILARILSSFTDWTKPYKFLSAKIKLYTRIADNINKATLIDEVAQTS